MASRSTTVRLSSTKPRRSPRKHGEEEPFESSETSDTRRPSRHASPHPDNLPHYQPLTLGRAPNTPQRPLSRNDVQQRVRRTPRKIPLDTPGRETPDGRFDDLEPESRQPSGLVEYPRLFGGASNSRQVGSSSVSRPAPSPVNLEDEKYYSAEDSFSPTPSTKETSQKEERRKNTPSKQDREPDSFYTTSPKFTNKRAKEPKLILFDIQQEDSAKRSPKGHKSPKKQVAVPMDISLGQSTTSVDTTFRDSFSLSDSHASTAATSWNESYIPEIPAAIDVDYVEISTEEDEDPDSHYTPPTVTRTIAKPRPRKAEPSPSKVSRFKTPGNESVGTRQQDEGRAHAPRTASTGRAQADYLDGPGFIHLEGEPAGRRVASPGGYPPRATEPLGTQTQREGPVAASQHTGHGFKKDYIPREQQEDDKGLREFLESRRHHTMDYEPGSDEDMLAVEPELDVDPFPNVPEIREDYEPSSESEYGDTDSLVDVFESLALADPVPRPVPRKPGRPVSSFPYFAQYELTRFSLAVGVPIDECGELMASVAGKYDERFCGAQDNSEFMETVTAYIEDLADHVPTLRVEDVPLPMPDQVWGSLKETGEWPKQMELSGTATFSETSEKVDFDLQLESLSCGSKTARFSYRFGTDRFLQMRLPSIPRDEKKLPVNFRKQKLTPEDVERQTIDWLVDAKLELLGRQWRCFYVRNDATKRRDKDTGTTKTESFLVALFFAERGVGIGSDVDAERELIGLEKAAEQGISTQEMTREQLISWHMPVHTQVDTMAQTDSDAKRGGIFAKLWSRITLGLSTARPTVTFEREQIKLVRDIMSPTGQSMNDGCSICSPAVMRKVRDMLDLQETPSAVQGRVGGAKGVWFVDPSADPRSEDIWIQVNDSQLKYQYHDEDSDPATADWARLTLFVINYSKMPSSAVLNMQLVPILAERRVPFQTFKEVLETHLDTDLEELMSAAQVRFGLRCWLQKAGMAQERTTMGWSILQNEASGFPQNKMEQMAMLVDAGFEPLRNKFLMDKLYDLVQDQVDRVIDHLHIRVPESISVLMIADPTGTLEAGEISMQFSTGFLDSHKNRSNCLEGEVLVARNPAHLPSDIRKVKAVCPTHRGLRSLTDVVVFSTKGDVPLASLLSGGDYDGDKAWITWDPRLVSSFQNSPSTYTMFDEKAFFDTQPLPPSVLQPDLHNPTFWRSFFHRGFSISLADSILGRTTNLLENYAYARNWRVDKNMVKYAKLCSVLVDAQKQGLVPKPETHAMLEAAYKAFPDRPVYRFPKTSLAGHPRLAGNPENWFLLDRLVFEVAKGKADEKFIRFTELRESADIGVDHDLTALSHREDIRHPEVLKQLRRELDVVNKTWKRTIGNDPSFSSFNEQLATFHTQYSAIAPLESACEKSEKIAAWRDGMVEPHSFWKLLKASTAYFLDQRAGFPWWMAGPELCEIKAKEVAFREGGMPPRSVTQDMYVSFKPNPKCAPKEAKRVWGRGVVEGGSVEEGDGEGEWEW